MKKIQTKDAIRMTKMMDEEGSERVSKAGYVCDDRRDKEEKQKKISL